MAGPSCYQTMTSHSVSENRRRDETVRRRSHRELFADGPSRDVVFEPLRGTRAYVGSRGAGRVAVIDSATGSIVADPVACQFPNGLAMHPDGGRVFATCPRPARWPRSTPPRSRSCDVVARQSAAGCRGQPGWRAPVCDARGGRVADHDRPRQWRGHRQRVRGFGQPVAHLVGRRRSRWHPCLHDGFQRTACLGRRYRQSVPGHAGDGRRDLAAQ